MEQTEERLLAQMEESLQVMEKAVESGMDPRLRSTSGLTGGDAWKMMKYGKTGGITGSFMTGAMARALAVSEYNAAMGKIVAAPTAGSCGIMPGCLVSVMKERGIAREKIFRGMFPVLHMDKIMIGDIMLLIPGLMFTNAIRDVLLGDTISASMRLVEALLLAAALALGFFAAIWLVRGIV